MKRAYKMLVENPEGEKPFGRPTHIWEDNIRIDLTDKGCEGVDWKHMTQDRDQWLALANTVMNLQVP